jgi:hypothetical protein
MRKVGANAVRVLQLHVHAPRNGLTVKERYPLTTELRKRKLNLLVIYLAIHFKENSRITQNVYCVQYIPCVQYNSMRQNGEKRNTLPWKNSRNFCSMNYQIISSSLFSTWFKYCFSISFYLGKRQRSGLGTVLQTLRSRVRYLMRWFIKFTLSFRPH